MKDALLIPCRITPEIFREFAVFDTMRRRKRWKGPALFAAMMTAFACVCFAQRGRQEQAVLIGGVLLAVGLGLPAVYFLSFFSSVRKKAKQLKLDNANVAYTVAVSPESVAVTDGKQRAEYAWGDIVSVYRIRQSTCLYVADNRAYLLPAGDRNDEACWALISRQVPSEKRNDLRK